MMEPNEYNFGDSVRGVLTYQDLLAACKFRDTDPGHRSSNDGPIKGAEKQFIRTAGYHLRLGKEYYLRVDSSASPSLATAYLDTLDQTILIPANGVAIVSTQETLAFDASLIGHLSLRQDLVMQGLIMPSQSQIDAGYVGGIFVLLYNLSAREVPLQLGEPILRLEVVRLHERSTREYRGEYREINLARALKAPIYSGLLDMRNQVDKMSRDINITQLIGGLIGLLVLISTIVTGALSYFGPLAERIHTLERRLDALEKQTAAGVTPSHDEVASLRREVDAVSATDSAGSDPPPESSVTSSSSP